jgi:hypothetical protein
MHGQQNIKKQQQQKKKALADFLETNNIIDCDVKD